MTARRRSRSEAFLLRLPSAVLEFPFEVLIAVVALVTGLGVVTGLLEPTSIAVLLPELGRMAWGAGLVLGGTTLALGVGTRRPMGVSAGLRLLSFLFVAYAVALLAYGGIVAAGVAAALYVAIGLLCGLRSLYVAVVSSMRQKIGEES